LLDVPEHVSSNRQQLSSCFILDGGVRAMRVEKCFPLRGQRPFTYLGDAILPMKNISGGDVHSLEGIKNAEYHLRKLGWEENLEK
jgi:hypothetical protein